MKEKLVQSYILLGNMPIYAKSQAPGANMPEGCEFVINTRIKYELGVASMQFIKQSHPSIYNIESTLYPEIELDISSLIRFKKLIQIRSMNGCNPTNVHSSQKEYIVLASTKLKKSIEYQKPAFVRAHNDLVAVIIENNKVQHLFEIWGHFQVECLIDLIDNIITQLSSACISYDIAKNYGSGVSKQSQPIAPYVYNPPTQINVPYVVPHKQDTWVLPIPVTCSNVPAPLAQMGATNLVAPPSITTSVIPQMPGIPTAPKF